METNYILLLTYIKDELIDCQTEVKNAIEKMSTYHCSLSSASEFIINKIDNGIKNFCLDNDFDYDDFNTYEIFGKDIEDIFWDSLD